MTVETRNGKITASKAVLNVLSCDLYEASGSYRKRGRYALSYEAEEMARSIYDALDSVGYYEGVKKEVL